jgi:signal transduction histidine kinase
MPELPIQYYALHGLIALLVLGLAAWHWLQARLGRFFLPLMILGMAILPRIVNAYVTPQLPGSPMTSEEGLMLRIQPVQLMALVLVAWQYRWTQMVLFSLGVGAFGLLTTLVTTPLSAAPIIPAMLAIFIQTLSFLVVGFGICILVDRLRTQSAALHQMNSQLRHYATTLDSLAISRERNRVARELHDTLAHTLSGLTVQLEAAKAYTAVDVTAAQPLLGAVLETARSGLQETRRALRALRASPLEDLGLCLALRQLAESVFGPTTTHIRLEIPEQLPPLAPDIEQCIYRIAQEALANVNQHAAAQHVQLTLACDDNQLTLTIQDDGSGFNMSHDPPSGHYGLSGMHERAELAGGTLSIASHPGRGTTIRLAVQLDDWR